MEKDQRAQDRGTRRPFERPALRRAGNWSLRHRTAGWGGHHHHHSGPFGGGFTSAGPGGWGGGDGGS